MKVFIFILILFSAMVSSALGELTIETLKQQKIISP